MKRKPNAINTHKHHFSNELHEISGMIIKPETVPSLLSPPFASPQKACGLQDSQDSDWPVSRAALTGIIHQTLKPVWHMVLNSI